MGVIFIQDDDLGVIHLKRLYIKIFQYIPDFLSDEEEHLYFFKKSSEGNGITTSDLVGY